MLEEEKSPQSWLKSNQNVGRRLRRANRRLRTQRPSAEIWCWLASDKMMVSCLRYYVLRFMNAVIFNFYQRKMDFHCSNCSDGLHTDCNFASPKWRRILSNGEGKGRDFAQE